MAKSKSTRQKAESSPGDVFRVIEAHRARLLNCLGGLQCLAMAVSEQQNSLEIERCVKLIEGEVQRVIDALDEVSLRHPLLADLVSARGAEERNDKLAAKAQEVQS